VWYISWFNLNWFLQLEEKLKSLEHDQNLLKHDHEIVCKELKHAKNQLLDQLDSNHVHISYQYKAVEILCFMCTVFVQIYCTSELKIQWNISKQNPLGTSLNRTPSVLTFVFRIDSCSPLGTNFCVQNRQLFPPLY
jgi:hypothetical protein